MCGRYRFDDGSESIELREIIEEVNRRPTAEPVRTTGEIRPTHVVPIVANNRQMNRAVFPMRWGYSLPDGKRIINARSETAQEKPLFRDGMRQRRCAVPATCYYEWERHSREKTKYAIRPRRGALFYMAGLYRIEAGRPVFAILTREPADNIAFIHDRMPVILPAERVGDWMNPANPADELLRCAVLSVDYQRAQDAEQLRMEL